MLAKAEVVGVSGLEWVLAALAIVVLAGITSIVVLVLIVRALYRRIRRSRSVDGALLRTRARLSRGPQRRVLGLRVRLEEILDSGRSAVDLAVRSGGQRSELPRLFRRIRDEGAVLDTQLRFLESETDEGVLAQELPAAGRRVEQVGDLVRRLRAAIGSGLAGLTDDALSHLQADLDREVAALHAGIDELHALNRLDRPQPITSTVRDKENPS